MKYAVFGMGITLINNWSLIREHFTPDFALDNNATKWGTKDSITGLECCSLDDIENPYDLEVLITAGDPYAVTAIGEQLDIRSIKHISLMDMIDIWCEDMPLPKDLNQMKKEEKKIVLFNTPEHDNIGDHLIALSEIDLIKETMSGINLYEITDIEYMWHHSKIRKRISKNDLIIISGGGFMGSLWLYNGETNIRKIINEYRDNKIIIFPQTIYFETNDRGKREYKISRRIYTSHENLLVLAREKTSYNTLCRIIDGDEKVMLFPDMGLLYRNTVIGEKKNEKCLVCFRGDKESVLCDEEREHIMEVLNEKGYSVKKTSMHEGVFDKKNRRYHVEKKLKEFSEAELVVTDTLHCMISAALVGTECVFFDNISGKINKVFCWIKNNKYIHYCNSIDDFNGTLDILTFEDNSFLLENEDRYKELLGRILEEALA